MAEYSRIAKRALGGFSIFGLVTIVTLLLAHSRALEEFEARSWDLRLGLPGALINPDPRIALVLLDQQSLEFGVKNFGVYWPWPRQMYEAVIKFLKAAGARGIAFDILFTEHTSENLDEDREFVEAVRSGPPIVLAAALSNEITLESPEDIQEFRAKQQLANQNSELAITLSKIVSSPPRYQSATLPFRELLEAAPALGNVSSAPDSDGIYRHTTPLAYMGESKVLSLPYSLFEATGGKGAIDWNNAIDRNGRLAIRFAGGTRSYRSYRISDLIQSYANISQGVAPILNPELFKDSFVIIGMTAPGLLDLRPTPLDERYPGVEINAAILDNLLNSSFIRKSPEWLALGIALGSTALIIIVILRLGIPHFELPFVLGILFLIIGPPLIATQYGWWLPLALPTISAFLTLILAYAYQYQQEGRKHRFIRNAFKHYVSPTVISQIVERPDGLSLGGDRRELTLFFSDIAGFTSIAEELPAQSVAELLNEFLSEMTSVVMQHGGTVDKYVGDSIVAFWNAPLPDPNHAQHAVEAALDCQRRLRELNSEFLKRYGTALMMRIGINTGTVSVGNFGSRERFAYTVVGDAANLASRLEGTNKAFGTWIILSKTTAQALPESIRLRTIGKIKVIGRTEPVEIYEPVEPTSLSNERLADLEQFEIARLALLSGNIGLAKESFEKIIHDPVASTYLTHIRTGEILPGGIIELKEK